MNGDLFYFINMHVNLIMSKIWYGLALHKDRGEGFLGDFIEVCNQLGVYVSFFWFDLITEICMVLLGDYCILVLLNRRYNIIGGLYLYCKKIELENTWFNHDFSDKFDLTNFMLQSIYTDISSTISYISWLIFIIYLLMYFLKIIILILFVMWKLMTCLSILGLINLRYNFFFFFWLFLCDLYFYFYLKLCFYLYNKFKFWLSDYIQFLMIFLKFFIKCLKVFIKYSLYFKVFMLIFMILYSKINFWIFYSCMGLTMNYYLYMWFYLFFYGLIGILVLPSIYLNIHPLSFMLVMLFYSIFMILNLHMFSMSAIFSYIIYLILIGGFMILFLYFNSFNLNNKIGIYKGGVMKFLYNLFYLLMIMILVFFNNNDFNMLLFYPNKLFESVSMNFWYFIDDSIIFIYLEFMNLCVFMMFYMFFTLVVIMKIFFFINPKSMRKLF